MPGPVAPVRPGRKRLESLNNPHVRFAPSTSIKTSASPPARKAHTCCDGPFPNDAGDGCGNCGTVWYDSQIVSEVTFGETASGAAVVQGATVHDGQRYANTMGGSVRGLGSIESREQTEMRGKMAIRQLCTALRLPESIETQAFSLYKLASVNRFVQGRGIRNVAAAVIYLTCRRRPGNTLLLMDISEELQVSVWRLGEIYKDFLQQHFMADPAQGNIHAVQEIEPLMLKYCRKLEFQEDSHRVAEDAVKILRRMKRDWMVQGRQPAGLCGACIILAARMNNFRRTVREVVYVVKVADSTINQRLHEFKRTKASNLTVNQFRKFSERLKDSNEPPAVYKRREKQQRKEERKRKRDAQDEGIPNDEEIQDAETTSDPKAKATTKRIVKKRKVANGKAKAAATDDTPATDPTSPAEPRRDADGFVIPDLPADSVLMDVDTEGHLEHLADAEEEGDELDGLPKKRGRPRKSKEPPIIIPEEELEIEAELEEELLSTMNNFDTIFKSFLDNPNHPILLSAARRALQLSQEYKPVKNVPNSEDITEEEFADDPEVMNCLLSPEETRNVERIWVTENEDWLRKQQAKMLAEELEAAKGIVKQPKKKRAYNRMGDLSVLDGKPAASAREAAEKMLKKRTPKQSKFSTKINYEILNNLFGPEDSADDSTSAGTTPAALPGTPPEVPRPPTNTNTTAIPEPEVVEEDEAVEEEGVLEAEDDGYGQGQQIMYDEEGNFIDPGHFEDDEEEGYNYDDY